MNGFGDQFLPGSGFSDDQRRRRDPRTASIMAITLRIGALTPTRFLNGIRGATGSSGVAGQQDFRHAHGSMNPGCQIHGVVRFDDIIKRPVAHGIDHRSVASTRLSMMTGMRRLRSWTRRRSSIPADPRQSHVGNDQINSILLRRSIALPAVALMTSVISSSSCRGSSGSTVRRNRSTSLLRRPRPAGW